MKLKYVVMGAILGTAVIVVGSNLINASTVQKEALTIDETIPRSGGTLEYGHYSYTNRQVIPGQEQTSALESISLTLCGLEQLFLGYRIEVSDGKGIDGMLSFTFY